jgi:hypothetical protein
MKLNSGRSGAVHTQQSPFCGAAPRWRRLVLLLALLAVCAGAHAATNVTLLGWGEKGMHFIDSDYSVFAIHPPGNTIHGQIVQTINGTQARLLTNATAAGITLTYEAVGDLDGSTNRTSLGKDNFWDYAFGLFGTNLPPDAGFGGSMPGTNNTPQPTTFTTDYRWFTAAGIPITPYDDDGKFNPFPLMRLVAKQGATLLTNLDLVVAVTDEMDCRLCHASGTSAAAAPNAGWVNDQNPDRDHRLNILRLHDERQSTNPVYATALATNGYSPSGLYATVKNTGQPVLCMDCHLSNLYPGSGLTNLLIEPLTQAMHTHHASVIDPRSGQSLNSETNRNSCYTCHGGGATHFLRGAMGTADTTTGQLAIQCQSCHGTMTMVGATNRVGWLSEPNCQACHVGDVYNTILGQIRFTNAITNGVLRTPASTRFATDPNVPTNGFSLFSFSNGHSNVMCSACHGSPHAEFPSSVNNDNIQSLQHQGHLGVMAECDKCHGTQDLSTIPAGGPHGMHPHDNNWADGGNGIHPFTAGDTVCGPCHGANSGKNKRGTILSQARNDRTYTTTLGTFTFWRGQTIGCTYCHNSSAVPTAGNTSAATVAGSNITFTLTASTNNVRIVTQPAHGMVGVSGSTATYSPEPGFVGTDKFTFASATVYKESNLATGTVVVSQVFTVADGIPDWWRKLYFGGTGTTTNSQSCASCDPDGDGLTNGQEYPANTDPTDRLSTFRIYAFQMTNNSVRVGFLTTITKRYAVERSDLLPAAWSVIASNVWGRNTTVQITDTNGAAASQRFYRARVLP